MAEATFGVIRVTILNKLWRWQSQICENFDKVSRSIRSRMVQNKLLRWYLNFTENQFVLELKTWYMKIAMKVKFNEFYMNLEWKSQSGKIWSPWVTKLDFEVYFVSSPVFFKELVCFKFLVLLLIWNFQKWYPIWPDT